MCKGVSSVVGRFGYFAIACAIVLLVAPARDARAAEGNAITVRHAADTIADIAEGEGAKSGSPAEMEEEMIARVRELLDTEPFEVNDSSGEYLPAPLVALMHQAVEISPMLKYRK